MADPDLVGLAGAIAAGAITAETATRAAIDRAVALADLNAVVRLDADAALERARACDRARVAGARLAPLHGVPVAHKDMFDRAGRVSGHGARAGTGAAATRTGTLLGRLDAAGAIDLGRLHMAEFAMGATGHNAHLGRCGNPWHPAAISGGSSSGSGAAVAARIVTAALASDTGGSGRLPAAFCGVVGLKTTHGRLPMDGVMPLSHSLDTVGPIARSARDVALLMTVLTDGEEDFGAGLTDDLAGLTIGVPERHYGEGLDAEVAAALAEARAALAALGARVMAVDMPAHDDLAALAGRVWLPEAAVLHADGLRDRPDDYGEQVRNRLSAGLGILATDYLRALRLRAVHVDAMMAGPLRRCDLLLTPVCRTIVPLADDSDVAAGAAMQRMIGDLSALTRPLSYLGLPAITTPMGRDARGVPIGLQLIAGPRREALLIRAAHAFDRATGWLAMPPPATTHANHQGAQHGHRHLHPHRQ